MPSITTYALTKDGERAAQSVSSPDTPAWRVLHYLSKVGEATPERIEQGTGLSHGDVITALNLLRNNKFVVKASGGADSSML